MVFVSLQPGGLQEGLGLKTGMPHGTSPDLALAKVSCLLCPKFTLLLMIANYL